MNITTLTNALRNGTRATGRVSALLLAALVLVSAGATAASAGITGRIDVKVPFAFTISGKTLPAGEYTLRELAPGTLGLKGEGGNLAFTTIARSSRTKAAHMSLVFKRYGDTYFLSRVVPADGASGYEVPTSDVEASLVRAGASAEAVTVEVGR